MLQHDANRTTSNPPNDSARLTAQLDNGQHISEATFGLLSELEFQQRKQRQIVALLTWHAQNIVERLDDSSEVLR